MVPCPYRKGRAMPHESVCRARAEPECPVCYRLSIFRSSIREIFICNFTMQWRFIFCGTPCNGECCGQWDSNGRARRSSWRVENGNR